MILEQDVQQTCNQYNQGTAKLIGPIDIRHSYENHGLIKGLMERGEAGDLMSLYTDQDRGPALLLGSGPSLDKAMPHIKDWRGAIITSTSQASTCVKWGRSPDIIVILDSQTKMDEFAVPEWGANSILILNPGTDKEIINYWKGPKYFYRQMDPANPLYNNIFPVAFDFIQSEILLFSCTPAAQLGIACALGFNPIFTVGLDMGFPGNRERFTRWNWQEQPPRRKDRRYAAKSFAWEPDYPADIPDKENLIMTKTGVVTERIHLFFKRTIFAVMMLETNRPRTPQLIDSSESIFSEFPKVPFREVLEKQGKGFEHLYRNREVQRRICERYLYTQNMFAIRIGTEPNVGFRYVETPDWRKSMPSYIEQLKRGGVPVESLETVLARTEELEKEVKDGA